nr:PhoD-like phosphatase N-terminal domain-containing protein [Bradyrhizobium ivorense]
MTGSLASAALAAPFGVVRGAPVSFSADPYTLGIASGCPRADSVILWTRLAPRPLEDGGMPDAPVEVEWQIAEDEKFARVVARGTEHVTADLAHSVHAEARGCSPIASTGTASARVPP